MALVRYLEAAMSKVYSFRLDEHNPRENQAKEVIEAWILKGYSLRHIIAEALINFSQSNDSWGEMNNLIDQLRLIVERSPMESSETETESKSDHSLTLSPAFISEMSKSIRQGTRIS